MNESFSKLYILKQIITLDPEHISCYSLTVEPNTLLHNKVFNGTITMPTEKIDLTMFEFGQQYLSTKQYIQYEISNYAKKNKARAINRRVEIYLDAFLKQKIQSEIEINL